jgi:hypothetical protein
MGNFRFLLYCIQILTGFAAVGQVTLLVSTNEMSLSRNTLDFEGYENFTIANFIYTNVGFTFTNDVGTSVYLIDARTMTGSGGRQFKATSPDFVIGSSSANHLIVRPSRPLSEVGVFFAAGAEISEFYYQRMSAFDADNQLIGSVNVQWDGDSELDQFIGMRSTLPIYSVRLEGYDSSWIPSSAGSAFDNLVFTVAIPPSVSISAFAPGKARISWPTNMPGFVLQESLNVSSTNWLNSPTGSTNPAIVFTTSSTRFYRLGPRK